VAGDWAVAEHSDEVPLVVEILPRSSVLQRTVPLGRETQVIASNVDRVLVICSLRKPSFSHGFLSRALVASSWRELPADVVLNKIDLCREGDEPLRDEILSVYEDCGYSIYQISCRTGEGIDELRSGIQGKTVVMTGPSGAGKTSLAKVFIPSLKMRIGDLNPKTSKGRHTTVAARLLPLDGETSLIDTPGLRMFSIEHIPTDDLQYCFPEFQEYIGSCHFRNCMHESEPGCAVKAAVNEGDIPRIRYDIYRDFLISES
jgi:ribosome biogenesis GTPase / thiamine phosphate phosphatase